MRSAESNWTTTLVFTVLAVAFAIVGLALTGLHPSLTPVVSAGLLVASLVCTAAAFLQIALRVRRLELENEGLIAELSEEFDRVNDKFEVYRDALEEPRHMQPEGLEASALRRVTIK